MLSNSNSLVMRKVSFSYFNGLVLRDIDLSISAGEMVGLIGPNGCGNTTLLKLATGFPLCRARYHWATSA